MEANKNAKADTVASGDRKNIPVVAIGPSKENKYIERNDSPKEHEKAEEEKATCFESHLVMDLSITGEAVCVASEVIYYEVAPAMDAG